MVDDGTLRRAEYEQIFYPTWNRTPEELLAPFRAGPLADRLTLHESVGDHVDDAETFPQWSRDHDAAAFARAYTPFVRAITEPSFFRWLEADRSPQDRNDTVAAFYAGLEHRIAAEPDRATCRWHTLTLRFERVT